MKVLLINGSPHPAGCTYFALNEVALALESEGIATEMFHIGSEPIAGCSACGFCRSSGKRRCVHEDTVNAAIERCAGADGLVFGSPVHYAAISGSMAAFLDRLFYASGGFPFKPGAAVVCCRRSGGSTALEQLNKYFSISQMPIVSSVYWNIVYGRAAGDAARDAEGVRTIRALGKNMAWLLKCIEAGRKAGISPP